MPAPMVASKRSTSPFCEQTLRFEIIASHLSAVSSPASSLPMSGAPTSTVVCFSAPLELRNSRERSTIMFPHQFILRRGSSFTTATSVASRFSLAASAMNFSVSSLAITTAILSCDSDIASSVPSRPSYFLVTASRFISSPSVSSPIATDTPPAPKSLQRFIIDVTSGLRKSLCSFLSSGALPFCTSAPQDSSECSVCDFEEPVAPPQPSRPVLPPSSITMSPGAGLSLLTLLAGAAPTTAPISILLAT